MSDLHRMLDEALEREARLREALSNSSTRLLRVLDEADRAITNMGQALSATAMERDFLRSAIAERIKERDEAAAREARLREALEYVLNVCPPIDPTGEDARRAARAALAAGAVKP